MKHTFYYYTLLLCCLCCYPALAQSPLNRVEYFINTDPGLGNATSIPVTQAVNISNQSAIVNIAGAPEGLNIFYLRSRSAAGKWSITNRTQFIKMAIPNSDVINKAEYFIDTDPGHGKATDIPLTPGTNITAFTSPVNIAAFAQGLHILYLRTRTATGRWSITNRTAFVKQIAASNITSVEYFIDTDPGTGAGTPIALNAVNPLAGFAAPVNITGLTGAHRLFIRSKDQNGKWSITNSIGFSISALAASPYINVNAVTDKQMCASEKFRLSFDAHGSFNNGNVFNVQLSDAAGNFANPYTIGTKTGTTSAELTCYVPSHLPTGNNYRVRVVSTNPVVTGAVSDTLFALRDRPDLGPDTLAAIVCLGETINLNPLYTTTGLTAVWNTANTTTAPAGKYQLIVTDNYGCKDSAVATVGQDVNVWKGTVSNSWHTPANWSRNRVPNAKTHVIIDIASPNICTVTANAEAASIQAKQPGQLKINANYTIQVKATCSPLPDKPQ